MAIARGSRVKGRVFDPLLMNVVKGYMDVFVVLKIIFVLDVWDEV